MTRMDDLLKASTHNAATSAGVRASEVGVTTTARLRSIRLDRLVPDPDNTRGAIDTTAPDMLELVESMRTSGLVQPIRAAWNAALERWQIVCGHKRHAAATVLGWETIDVVCYPPGTPKADIVRDQLVENAVRSNPDKLAVAKRLEEFMRLQGCNATELAGRVGMHKSTVSRYLALLELPPDEQQAVAAGAENMKAAVVRTPRRRRGRRVDRNLAELAAGTVRLKRGRSWGELLEQLRCHVESDGRADAA